MGARNPSHLFFSAESSAWGSFLACTYFTHLGTHCFRRKGDKDKAFEQLLGCQEPETRCRFAFSRSIDFNTLLTVRHRCRWRAAVAACLLYRMDTQVFASMSIILAAWDENGETGQRDLEITRVNSPHTFFLWEFKAPKGWEERLIKRIHFRAA